MPFAERLAGDTTVRQVLEGKSTLGAPAAALGLIEGISDGLTGAAKVGGGALADDPGRR